MNSTSSYLELRTSISKLTKRQRAQEKMTKCFRAAGTCLLLIIVAGAITRSLHHTQTWWQLTSDTFVCALWLLLLRYYSNKLKLAAQGEFWLRQMAEALEAVQKARESFDDEAWRSASNALGTAAERYDRDYLQPLAKTDLFGPISKHLRRKDHHAREKP